MNRKIPVWLVAVLSFAILICPTAWTTFTPSTAHAQDGFSCANVSEIPLAECEALVAISAANPDARLPDDWLTTNMPCNWRGIGCQDGHITSLSLAINQLTSVPPEIGNLSSLSSLYLSRNQLTTLPTEIGNLSSLIELSLEENQLTSVPMELGNLPEQVRVQILADNITIEKGILLPFIAR